MDQKAFDRISAVNSVLHNELENMQLQINRIEGRLNVAAMLAVGIACLNFITFLAFAILMLKGVATAP